jgi:glycosyltransferase involved in cell wall biosynthesis
MDGIEWKRAKWRLEARVWLYLNEWVGAATSSALIADHPEIARHLRRRGFKNNIIMIPYGADEITTAPESPVRSLGLEPGRYLLSVGRVEPENNTLMMVQAYARRLRKIDFVCLGSLNPKENRYHAEVMAAGEGRVLFPGAIYESEQVKALRFHAAAYCHGHSVGGTNPSLVESLGAGNAIVAHRNQFNSWVAGPGQLYFDSVDECARAFDSVEEGGAMLREAAWSSRRRHLEHFKWEPVLRAYEAVCERFVAQPSTCLLDFEC